MTYEEAIEIMKRGGSVQRDGKTYKLITRGVHDVTDPENSVHVYMSEEDCAATNWEEAAYEEQPSSTLVSLQ